MRTFLLLLISVSSFSLELTPWRGVPSAVVTVGVSPGPVTVNEEALKAAVEIAFRKAGFPVVSPDQVQTGTAIIEVTVRSMTSENVAGKVTGSVYSLEMDASVACNTVSGGVAFAIIEHHCTFGTCATGRSPEGLPSITGDWALHMANCWLKDNETKK
jgi:hypothetical protein